MSKEFLPHIFDTFSQEDSSSTNKYGSSGLGMAITKSIVEMMNGNIQVESEKGKGTTFTVTVTLMDATGRGRRTTRIEIHPAEMNVLVIDDDPIALRACKLVLEKAGIAAETAASGAEAIEKVQLRHARRAPYNLILVDWKMPEMDGVETTRQIRSIVGDESAIIILTAYRWDDVLEEALKAGVDSFLPKPLFAASVLEEFKSALKRRVAASGKAEHKADLTGRRILLAEDMEVNAEIMMMVLSMREMQADHAENGRIAVEMFQSHEQGYYDAILMDMRMPEMDGLEATRRIRAPGPAGREDHPHHRADGQRLRRGRAAQPAGGLNAHLSKPVQPEALYETLPHAHHALLLRHRRVGHQILLDLPHRAGISGGRGRVLHGVQGGHVDADRDICDLSSFHRARGARRRPEGHREVLEDHDARPGRVYSGPVCLFTDAVL